MLSTGHVSPTISNVMDDSVDPSNDARSVTFGQLVRQSALELILTFFMLFGVTSIVRWVIGPSLISRTFPEIQVELLIVGASVAILIAGLILSPPGRATGGHMNPAISLAMWRFGAFPGAGVIPYVIAQLLGSVLGVLVARAVWGPVVAEPSVAYAVLADCNRPTDQYHCHGAHLICVGRSTSGRLRRIESEDLFRSRPITLCKIKLMRPCDTANA